MDVTPFVELGRIENGYHSLCLLNHHLVQQRFLHIRRRDAVLERERIHTQKQLVPVEITQNGECQRSYYGMAVHTHVTA